MTSCIPVSLTENWTEPVTTSLCCAIASVNWTDSTRSKQVVLD